MNLCFPWRSVCSFGHENKDSLPVTIFLLWLKMSSQKSTDCSFKVRIMRTTIRLSDTVVSSSKKPNNWNKNASSSPNHPITHFAASHIDNICLTWKLSFLQRKHWILIYLQHEFIGLKTSRPAPAGKRLEMTLWIGAVQIKLIDFVSGLTLKLSFKTVLTLRWRK